MPAAAEGSGQTTKAVTSDSTNSSTMKDQQKPAAALEEDDEFEDFPIDGNRNCPPVRVMLIGNLQIGRQKKARSHLELRAAQRIFGRRAGTTMIRARTFQSN